MDVTVTGRHCNVSDEFRAHVMDKITKIEKISEKVIRVDVQVSAYANKRQADEASRVEITVRGKGPVVRAEAASQDKMAAFEHAMDRLRAQLRKAQDRKKVHRGQHAPRSLQEATAQLPSVDDGLATAEGEEPQTRSVAGIEVTGDGPLVVREKTHPGAPMSLEQAIEQMELVGHDFYLFVDSGSGQPSVAYRRRAYDFGVIHLDVNDTDEAKSA
ncbi:ribosome hibernation-promoting factor, HPF/YfiA family [Mariniluteicoccus flavus]